MPQLVHKTTEAMLTRYIAQIEKAYSDLGYTLGWEFLYTPADTINCPNEFMLVGINPGGDEFGITTSVEEGNAYLVQNWSRDGPVLQEQVKAFFGVLADRFVGEANKGNRLLNETMTSNFCPFRSPTWKKLPRQAEAVAFSQSLWSQIFSEVAPRVIFCMGKPALRILPGTLP